MNEHDKVNIFWVDEVREIVKKAKMPKIESARIYRLCDCYEKLYSMVNLATQKTLVTKYLAWFHNTFKDEEN